MANNVDNIKLEPVDLVWGQPELTKVTCVADVADSLDGTYLTIDTPTTGYYVWNDGVSVADPAPAGRTAIPVAYTTGDSAAVLAGLWVTEIEAVVGLNAKLVPGDADSLYIENGALGVVTPSADVDTTFTVVQSRVGSSLVIGFTDGDVEVGFSEDMVDITTHQLGTTVIDKIRSGINLDPISIAMKESDAAKIGELFSSSGVEKSSPAVGFGLGSSKKFTNISAQCRYLNLHPVRNVSSDLTGDYTFWRAYPLIAGITFSGESAHMVNVEFQVIPDPVKSEDVEFFWKGDYLVNHLR